MQQNENITLKPIIEPDPVPFTMDTIGWKILFFILFCSILFAVYKYYQYFKKNKYRRDAILTISEIYLNKENSVPSLITQIMFQIKQVSIQTYGRKKVASLEGDSWLQFVDDKVKGVDFSQYHKIIIDSVYKNQYNQIDNFNRDEFIRMSKKWIKEHA